MSDKYRQILIDYANNRKAVSVIRKKIDALNFDSNKEWREINLSIFRESWFEQGYAWNGWVAAVADFGDNYTQLEMDLALLRDEKKVLLREAGQLKRNMCAYGRGLINSEVMK